ncbi:hypothetical protein AKJ16_DCAP05666 [Drosera capensis]
MLAWQLAPANLHLCL